MACNECGEYKNSCNTCNSCEEQDISCSCAVKDLSTDCSVYTGDDLECSGIEKGTILTSVIKRLDEFICNKFDEVIRYLTLTNVGLGAEVYKGIGNTGEKEIRTLLTTESITVVQQENEILHNVDQEWLDSKIEEWILNNSTVLCAAIESCTPPTNLAPLVDIEYNDGTTTIKTCQL